MRKNICILLFLLLNISVSANDGRVVIGPSIEILDNENTNIKMQSEVINITINKEYYEIAVEFDFYNEGPDETVLIGFPVESWGYIDEKYIYENISDFKSYINGKLISEYIIKEEEYEGLFHIVKKRWYLREILFPEKSHTYSKVTYRVLNQYYLDGFADVGYIFGTGRSWKDKIGKMTVYIKHDDDIIILEISHIKAFDFTWEADGIYKFEIENIEPEIEDKLWITIQKSDYFFNPLYTAYNAKKLLYKDENDIQYYTINQIRLLINSYFTNQEYQLNEVDIKNINYLLRLENMIPRNPQKNYIKLLHEVDMLESFDEKQDIKREYIMENNSDEIYSGLIQNDTGKKSISFWLILIFSGGGVLTVCLLFYVIKKLKYR
jgi:hypothetical protein